MLTPISYAHLQSLSVTQSYRHVGIGKQLLRSAEAWALDHGSIELRLEIWEFSAGPSEFYKKAGHRAFRHALTKNL
jgi:GNAT superfamily N-acetyltransferase